MRAASPVLSVKAGALAAPWWVAMKELMQTTTMLPKKQVTKMAVSVPPTGMPGQRYHTMHSAVPIAAPRQTGPRPNRWFSRGVRSAPMMPPAARAVLCRPPSQADVPWSSRSRARLAPKPYTNHDQVASEA